ncbi:MAG: Fic family protein [Anaerovoracaceae bacterium]
MNISAIMAKKEFTQLLYNVAKIENLNVTFPQTQTILDGGIVNNVPVSEIETIINLRDAWKYVINNYDNTLNLDYICKINSFVGRNQSYDWGVLRYGNVTISGTEFEPKMPVAEEVTENINKILQIVDPIDRASEYFCFATKNQLFWDGNKRTSMLIANKILIDGDIGILSLKENKLEEFNTNLKEYYDTGNKEPLKETLKEAVVFKPNIKEKQRVPRNYLKESISSVEIEDDELEL